MKKQLQGVLFGAIAGVIDVIPMILQDLTWDANFSAFSMWVIIGYLISVVKVNMNAILKGILISLLVLFPSAILIGSKEPFTLIPILVITICLGGILGFSIHKINKD